MNFFEPMTSNVDVERVKHALGDEGFYIFDDLVSDKALVDVKQEIDNLSTASDVEVNYGGSEHRIWKAHNKSNIIGQFFDFSNKIMSEIEGGTQTAYDILAVRNLTLANNSSELTKGRWHLDSFKRQLKVFVFLTDVSADSGPFEMIPRSQRTSFKLKHALKGELITLQDIIRNDGGRSYAHLKEQLIERIVTKGYEPKTFTVPKGTVAVIDTSSVHRAKPCTIGERYALTAYFH